MGYEKPKPVEVPKKREVKVLGDQVDGDRKFMHRVASQPTPKIFK